MPYGDWGETDARLIYVMCIEVTQWVARAESRWIEKSLFWFTGKRWRGECKRGEQLRVGSATSPGVPPALCRQDSHCCGTFCRLPLSVPLLSRSSPFLIQTLMKCVVEPAFCCFILNILNFLSLCVQGKSLFHCNLSATAAEACKKKYICIYAVELAKREADWRWR